MHHAANITGYVSDTNMPHTDSHVIIADDDPSIVLLLKHVLVSEGYTVSEAYSGQEAIELCNSTEYDLAILDIVMPDINGFEACKQLQKLSAETPPVLLITSLDDDLSVDQAFSCGATEYITKPINWSVFKHRVRRLIESHKRRETIRHLEFHNPVTGLANRSLMMDRLESALLRCQRSQSHLALILIDIDNFKLVNETLGHSQGDELLRSVSTRLARTVRETDTLSHIGGDEFSIIIEDIRHVEDIAIIADNLSRILEHDITLDDQSVHIKASMGITLYPQDGTDTSTLLRNAEVALYRAKDRGRNRYQFFSPELSQQALQKLNIENSLRNAIENNELVIHYQPKVHMQSGIPSSMEALVRWQHPQKGLISPDEFIPTAEESGLIVPLGEWVIKTACQQFSQWRKAGLAIESLSINVSARQFKEQNLVSLFENILSETDLDPHFIELEITESALLHNEHHSESRLNTLHNMGIRIAIDDFGTGYASLSYLKRLPIDTLKIDTTFTDGLLHDGDDKAIVLAIIGLAKAMDMELVAEGIENEEQLKKLIELEVDYGQGYYWSPAVAAEEYEILLEKLSSI